MQKDLAFYDELPKRYGDRFVKLTSMKTGRPFDRYWLMTSAVRPQASQSTNVVSSRSSPSRVRYPPRPDDHPIEIFISPQDVERPYVKVALLTSTGSGAYASWDDIMESMKEKARAVGADALVIGPKQQVAEFSAMPTGKLQEAVAIRYTD